MRSLHALFIASLTLAIAAAPALAQGATVTLSIQELTPSGSVNAGQTHSAAFKVQMTASGFQCTQPATVTLDLALTNAAAAPPGVTASVDPANLTLTIPGPAVYGSRSIP